MHCSVTCRQVELHTLLNVLAIAIDACASMAIALSEVSRCYHAGPMSGNGFTTCHTLHITMAVLNKVYIAVHTCIASNAELKTHEQ